MDVVLQSVFSDALFDQLGTLTPRLSAGLAVLAVFWGVGIALERLVDRVGLAQAIDPDLVALLSRSAKLGTIAFGAITALGTLGINVSAMVTGLGLTGLALGFALKEIGSNAMAGLQILIYKPFHRNDTINVLTFQGRVTEVNLRYTMLENASQKIFVPNTLLLTNAVIITPPEASNPASEKSDVPEQVT